jgi:hypothetical protein
MQMQSRILISRFETDRGVFVYCWATVGTGLGAILERDGFHAACSTKELRIRIEVRG